METPQEKAKRLNIPFAPFVPVKQVPQQQNKNFYDDAMKKYLSTIVKICECGKEITIGAKENPCGIDRCPFGYETFKK